MKTVIVNAHVISPGVNMPDAAVEISGDRIVKVAKTAKPGRNDWVFDAKGAYVMPGFIDVHLHGACYHKYDYQQKAFKECSCGLCNLGLCRDYVLCCLRS